VLRGLSDKFDLPQKIFIPPKKVLGRDHKIKQAEEKSAKLKSQKSGTIIIKKLPSSGQYRRQK
jgi:hypothetical protein